MSGLGVGREHPDTPVLNVLELFAGIGGIGLGLERAGMRVVGQVELDDYCRCVLEKHWPDVPRHDDVRTAADWWLSTERPRVDVICGGFPCTDIAAPGRRNGIIEGEQSGLWAPMADVVRRVRPRYVLVENSPRVLVRARDGYIPAEIIAADLAALGYDLEWDCIPAAAVGAPHLRDRWFAIAYADRDALRVEPVAEPWSGRETVAGDDGAAQPVAYTDRDEWGRRSHEGRPLPASATQGSARLYVTEPADSGWWGTEPDVGRVVDGLPGGLDRPRKRALGNAVVPQVSEYVGRLIVAHAASGVAA